MLDASGHHPGLCRGDVRTLAGHPPPPPCPPRAPTWRLCWSSRIRFRARPCGSRAVGGCDTGYETAIHPRRSADACPRARRGPSRRASTEHGPSSAIGLVLRPDPQPRPWDGVCAVVSAVFVPETLCRDRNPGTGSACAKPGAGARDGRIPIGLSIALATPSGCPAGGSRRSRIEGFRGLPRRRQARALRGEVLYARAPNR